MLMARIGAGDADGADPGLINNGQDRRQIHIVDMRTVPIAEADMRAHLFRWDIGQGEVHGIDMDFDPVEEFAQRPVLEHEGAFHREVGRVELQDMAFRYDRSYSVFISRATPYT